MLKVVLPSALSHLTGGERSIDAPGETVGEALRFLQKQHPALAGWVLNEQGCLREHVNLFLGSERVDLEAALHGEGELHVLQAISGGRDGEAELLVGTRKGLFILRRRRGTAELTGPRLFPGQTVDFACHDHRSGRYFAAVTHGQFGPRLYWAEGPEREWKQVEGLTFPEQVSEAVSRIWVVVAGAAPGELWAGVAPAALFHSTDAGSTWSLNRALWEVPSRPQWEGGLGGLCLHSICPWPGDRQRLAVGISAAGVWMTEDGGASWRRGGRGLVPRYLPEEARQDALMLCVHNMHRAPAEPSTLYMQFHGGVYRSDDGGLNWNDISAGLPADFGFPLAIDPNDPARAFVIPLTSDQDRVSPGGRLRVFETRDRGASWRALGEGLPQENAHLTVLRQALTQDGDNPLGLYFGATSGELFSSADGGETWMTLARRLPPILSVRCGRS